MTANWSIKPEAWSGPVAFKLLSEFQRENIVLVMLFGMYPILHPIMQGLKYLVVDPIPRFWAVFEGRPDESSRLIPIAYPDWPARRLAKLMSRIMLSPNLEDAP